MRDIEQARLRRESGGLPVLGSGWRRTDIPGRPITGLLSIHYFDNSGLQIHILGRVHKAISLRTDYLACTAIDDIDTSVAVRVSEYFAQLTLYCEIEQDILVDAIVFMCVMRAT